MLWARKIKPSSLFQSQNRIGLGLCKRILQSDCRQQEWYRDDADNGGGRERERSESTAQERSSQYYLSSYLVALGAEYGHGCEFCIKLTGIGAVLHRWLPWWLNLAILQLIPINGTKEWMRLDFLGISWAASQSLSGVPFEKTTQDTPGRRR